MARQKQWMFILPCLALAAWLVAGTIRVLMADPLRDNPFHLPNQTGPAPDFLPGDEVEDNHIVVERNYFRSSVQGRQPEPPGPGPIPPDEISRLPAKLIGTVVASQEDWSLALITAAGETELYRLGDPLLNRAVVAAVLTDRVVLERDGRREYLAFSEDATISVRKEPVSSPAALQEKRLAKPSGPNSFVVDREELEKRLARPGDLLRRTRITLAFDRRGEIEGIRLAMGRAASIFRQAGLRNGDVIHRIGPYAINGPERMLEIYQKLKTARELDVELTRAGKRKTLRYRID